MRQRGPMHLTSLHRATICPTATTAVFLILLIFLLKADEISRVGFVISFGASAVFIVLDRMLLDVIFWATMKGSATAKLLIIDGVAAEPGHDHDARPDRADLPEDARHTQAADAGGYGFGCVHDLSSGS